MNDRVRRLEEKIAYLERHVTEQDKAMLEFAEQLELLQGELKLLRARLAGPGDEAGADPASERPPHY